MHWFNRVLDLRAQKFSLRQIISPALMHMRVQFLIILIISCSISLLAQQRARITMRESNGAISQTMVQEFVARGDDDVQKALKKMGAFDAEGNIRDGVEVDVEMLDDDSGNGNSSSFFSIIPGQSSPPPSACQAYLGVMLKRAEGALEGALITFVEPTSPAAESGIRMGDIIVKLDELVIREPQDAIVYIRGKCKGDRIKIKIIRDRKKKNYSVVLSEKHIPQANVWDIPRDASDNAAAGSERAFLGVTPAAEQLPSGARVMVQPNSAAEKLGLRDYDNITELNGEVILSFNDLSKRISEMKPGDEVEIVVSRDDKVKKLSGVLGSRMTGGSGDLKYFFDDKGLDEGGFPIMDFEFDMDMSELQRQLEELLRLQELPMNSPSDVKIRINDASEQQLIDLSSCKESPTFELISIGLNEFQNDVILRLLPTLSSPVRIELLDSNGEVIYMEERKVETEYTRSLELRYQNKGQYFLRIAQGENCIIRSIVKSE